MVRTNIVTMSLHSPIDAAYLASRSSESPNRDFLRACLISAMCSGMAREKASRHADMESMKYWVCSQHCTVAPRAASMISKLKKTAASSRNVQPLGTPWIDTINKAAGSPEGQEYLKSVHVRSHGQWPVLYRFTAPRAKYLVESDGGSSSMPPDVAP